jgi:predicted pyridoxine 5'-phosphate oxidase superfamily flavin-nucleotide-binding protein
MENEPNVSPKEMFTYHNEYSIIIANIASPISVRNILENPKVCVSFVDVLVQKGYKLKGEARIITKEDLDYIEKKLLLVNKFSDSYPFRSIIEIKVDKIDPIIAPSYFLFPETTTEESQIKQAIKTYKMHLE